MHQFGNESVWYRKCTENVSAPVAPYRRKNGYWCSMMFTFTGKSTNSYNYSRAVSDCNLNGLVLSSMETEEEKASYIDLVKRTIRYDLTAFWVGASLNETTQQYYWDDGQAVPTINQQPTVVDHNGSFAWFINKNSSVPGYGDHRVVAKSGRGTPQVNGVICGAPGLQFN